MKKKYIEISKLPNFEITVEGGQKFILLPFEHLSDIPTVDVIEPVRCQDCIYATLITSLKRYDCNNGYGSLLPTDHFCSCGVRKEKV